MPSLILRFRDLTIPSGETIRRHKAVIESRQAVWWGWMKRNREEFPEEAFRTLSQNIADGHTQAYLFDSGSDLLFSAAVAQIYAIPRDICLTPDPDTTPPYMAEAFLPAWFKLTSISDSAVHDPTLSVEASPTLNALDVGDNEQLSGLMMPRDLRKSQATLWIGSLK